MRTTTRMTRVLTIGAVAFALLGAACGDDNGNGGPATGSGGDGESTTEQAKSIKTISPSKLTVCSDIPYAPFEFEENGQLQGIDVEIVKAISGRLGFQPPQFVDTDFDGIFAALKAGKCDIIASSVSITEERKKEMDFSEGYFEIQQSLLVRKADAGRYKDFESLKGRTVGVQSGTTGADYAKEQGGAAGVQIKEFTGADELFTALRAGQIDGVVQDYPVNAFNAKSTGETVVAKRFDSDKEEYGLVIPKGRTDLKKTIDDALEEIKSDDTYPTILRTYLGDDAPTQN